MLSEVAVAGIYLPPFFVYACVALPLYSLSRFDTCDKISSFCVCETSHCVSQCGSCGSEEATISLSSFLAAKVSNAEYAVKRNGDVGGNELNRFDRMRYLALFFSPLPGLLTMETTRLISSACFSPSKVALISATSRLYAPSVSVAAACQRIAYGPIQQVHAHPFRFPLQCP